MPPFIGRLSSPAVEQKLDQIQAEYYRVAVVESQLEELLRLSRRVRNLRPAFEVITIIAQLSLTDVHQIAANKTQWFAWSDVIVKASFRKGGFLLPGLGYRGVQSLRAML